MTTFLISIAATIRIVGSFHDALSNPRVRWLPWHAVNWIRRDLIIAAIVWHIHGAPWDSIDAALWWMMWIGLNIAAHKFFYWAGQEISFWILAKHRY